MELGLSNGSNNSNASRRGGEGYRIPPDSSRGVFPLGLEGLNPQRNISYCEYMLNINVS